VIKDVLPRNKIPVEHTWDLYSIYPNDDAWEKAFEEVSTELSKLNEFQGRLSESPTVIADWLDVSEEIFTKLGKVYLYAHLFHAADTADQLASVKNAKAKTLFAKTFAANSFSYPELLAIGLDKLNQWIKSEPRLAHLEHHLDKLARQQTHIRSKEVEELFSLVQDPFETASTTHRLITDTDMTFPAVIGTDSTEYTITQGSIRSLLVYPDRKVRHDAWKNYADQHLAYKNTMANCLMTVAKQHAFMAKAKRYNSSLEASTSKSHIPTDVFHKLIETYRKNTPTWHRYWRLRRKILGYSTLHEYDVWAPLTTSSPNISFEQATEWICEGMKPLGDEYVSVMRRGICEQHWVDIYPNKGKTAGAFSACVKGTHPFILMNYTNDIFGLSTFAHELGHSMHSYFSKNTQPLIYAYYTTFAAEVASNFNQALVRHYLFRTNGDRNFQIALIEETMANFYRYFFIMPALSCLELEIHERVERGQGFSADELISLMADLFAEGYGTEVEMDRERIGITWAKFSMHLYMNFYVYQYATGISAAHAISQKVLNNEPNAVENYLAFLKSGSSMYPLDALKMAGVDMTSPTPIEDTFDVMRQLIDRLEVLTNP